MATIKDTIIKIMEDNLRPVYLRKDGTDYPADGVEIIGFDDAFNKIFELMKQLGMFRRWGA